MGSEYGPAVDMFVDEQRVFIGAKPRAAIVIHKTAGGSSARNIANYFATTPEKTSSHFVVDNNEVVQCVSLNDGAAANCCMTAGHDTYWDQFGGVNLNLVTISIEHVDPSTDNSTPCSSSQLDLSFKLVDWLCKQFNITAIKTHASIDPVNRSRCPGNYPMQDLIDYVGGAMGVPDGWSDDGTVLTSPNKIPVVRGFRDHILNNNWDSDDWPLDEEHASNPLEYSNSTLQPGTSQTFRKTRLEWNSTSGVFVGWVGQEYRWLIDSYNQSLSEIASLKQQLTQLQNSPNKVLIDKVLVEIKNLESDLGQF